MPDFPIVDAHVHLYDPARIDYPWMANVPLLREPHLPERFRAASAPVEVSDMVFVEVDAAPGRHLDEVAFIEELAGSEPRLGAMVASMPLERGEAVLADLESYASTGLARGVRRLIQNHEDEPGWALREPFVAMVGALARFDLGFDLCIRHTQLPDAIALVRRCPEVRFVLDHIGKPPIREGVMEPWRARLTELAAEPNVWCKLSGVVTEADHERWTVEEIAPYVAHAIERFGFERIMYGGDWPVSRLATDYARWVETLDRIVAGSSPEELRRLYRDNARAFYRIEAEPDEGSPRRGERD